MNLNIEIWNIKLPDSRGQGILKTMYRLNSYDKWVQVLLCQRI
jgi:hypothetical protein